MKAAIFAGADDQARRESPARNDQLIRHTFLIVTQIRNSFRNGPAAARVSRLALTTLPVEQSQNQDCRCASRNQRSLSNSRVIAVKRSVVIGSSRSSDSCTAVRSAFT